MPRSPQWMDLYQIWFRVSSRGRNQLCGILLQSAHGFRFCEGSNFAISHWLGRSPLTQCWRYRAACDNNNNVVVVYVVVVLSSSSSTLSSSPELKYKYRFISTNPQDTEELGQLQYCRQDGRPFFKKNIYDYYYYYYLAPMAADDVWFRMSSDVCSAVCYSVMTF